MPVIGKFLRVWRIIVSHNWLAIIYFNFKMLPLSQAVRLPFDFYYSVRFENLSGKVVLSSKNIRRAMIKIGGRGSEMFSRSQSIIDIRGNVEFSGVCEFGHGILITVGEGAHLKFGSNVRLGAKTKLYCKNKINFGNEIDFSWECQIFDTNFHYMIDTNSDVIEGISGFITIGDGNWFGNRVTAMKGCKTPNYTIVASNSLCNKDYSDLGNNVMIGGTPAKILRRNVRRLFEGVDDSLIAQGVEHENMCAADLF